MSLFDPTRAHEYENRIKENYREAGEASPLVQILGCALIGGLLLTPIVHKIYSDYQAKNQKQNTSTNDYKNPSNSQQTLELQSH